MTDDTPTPEKPAVRQGIGVWRSTLLLIGAAFGAPPRELVRPTETETPDDERPA